MSNRHQFSLNFNFFVKSNFVQFLLRIAFNPIQFFREIDSSQTFFAKSSLFFCETIFLPKFSSRETVKLLQNLKKVNKLLLRTSLRSNLRLNFAAVKQTAILLAQLEKTRARIFSAQLLSLYEKGVRSLENFSKTVENPTVSRHPLRRSGTQEKSLKKL